MSDVEQSIDNYLSNLPAWQKANLLIFRKCIHDIDSSISEDWKWSVPVFLLDDKIIFAMSAFKAHTKYNFILNGASIKDDDKLFNNGFDSKKSRAIDLKEHDQIDAVKLASLISRSVDAVKN